MDSKILQLYSPHIRRRVRTRLVVYGLQGKVDSLDICQSIMAQLVRRNALGDLGRADSPERFLAKTIQNKIIEVLRRHRAEKRDARLEVARTVDWERLRGSSESPSVRVMRSEIYRAVLDSLDAEERRICELRSQGWRFAAIAREMLLTSDAVRMKYNRALDKLRQRFDSEA